MDIEKSSALKDTISSLVQNRTMDMPVSASISAATISPKNKPTGTAVSSQISILDAKARNRTSDNEKEKEKLKKKSSTSSTTEAKVRNKDTQARSRLKSSNFRGVSRCAKDGRWQARIRIGRTVKYLGRFKTEAQAAASYDVAAKEFHGPRAVLNFETDANLDNKKDFDSNSDNNSDLKRSVKEVSKGHKERQEQITEMDQPTFQTKIPSIGTGLDSISVVKDTERPTEQCNTNELKTESTLLPSLVKTTDSYNELLALLQQSKNLAKNHHHQEQNVNALAATLCASLCNMRSDELNNLVLQTLLMKQLQDIGQVKSENISPAISLRCTGGDINSNRSKELSQIEQIMLANTLLLQGKLPRNNSNTSAIIPNDSSVKSSDSNAICSVKQEKLNEQKGMSNSSSINGLRLPSTASNLEENQISKNVQIRYDSSSVLNKSSTLNGYANFGRAGLANTFTNPSSADIVLNAYNFEYNAALRYSKPISETGTSKKSVSAFTSASTPINGAIAQKSTNTFDPAAIDGLMSLTWSNSL